MLRHYTATPVGELLRMRPVVAAYWWDGTPNFGDALTPWLLPRLGITPVLVAPERARLSGVGSILEQLGEEFEGTVWGSGVLYDRPVRLPHARFAAVRGELTRQLTGCSAAAQLGDPGLLVGQVVRRPSVRWRLAVVPHHAHLTHPEMLRLGRTPGSTVVDVTRGPGATVRHIASAAAVLTSSLHGLVTADAFGIPAVWTMAEPLLWGGDLKFRDHESAVLPARSRSMVVDPATTVEEVLSAAVTADPDVVAARCAGLRSALSTVSTGRARPALAWRHGRSAERRGR